MHAMAVVATTSCKHLMANIGIVSLGSMGTSLAYSLSISGHNLFWASDGRSEKTKMNETLLASSNILVSDVGNISELSKKCEFIFCVGRVNIAEETVISLKDADYSGVLVDCNTLWDEVEENRYYELLNDSQIQYVDSALRGYPVKIDSPSDGLKRVMLLSGQKSNTVADLFSDGIWKTVISENKVKSYNRWITANAPDTDL